ncbi:MAG: hypothetical protein H5U24_12310 [Thioclava marina]|uniref:hypothetical protein n=1 Tax=Thioclava marina TaxID=1915077 RepID=UPI00199341A1|nr:hypothetical protein [Thioclava marina]MBC7146172.1 hypothetical protein [Thioclava marina]
MRGYQFGHVETWSQQGATRSSGKVGRVRKNGQRAWRAEQVLDEAERAEGSCDHVLRPDRTPQIIPGSCGSFDELRAAHEQATNVTQSFPYTDPKTGSKTTRKRKLRKDSHTLYSSVFSLPITSAEARADPALMSECRAVFDAFVAFEKDRIEAAGGEFALAVIHTDEAQMHIHLFALDRERGSVIDLHPGRAAFEDRRRHLRACGRERSLSKEAGDQLYKEAMREWQDDLYEAVSRHAGLLRFGPRRERLSRAEYRLRMASREQNAMDERRAVEARKTRKAAEGLKRAADDLFELGNEHLAEIAKERAALGLEKERDEIVRRENADQVNANASRARELDAQEERLRHASQDLVAQKKEIAEKEKMADRKYRSADAILATADLLGKGESTPDQVPELLRSMPTQANQNVRAKLARMRRAPHAAVRMAEMFGAALIRLRTTAQSEAEALVENERSELAEGLDAVTRVTNFAAELIARFVPPASRENEHGKLRKLLMNVARVKTRNERRKRDDKGRSGDER